MIKKSFRAYITVDLRKGIDGLTMIIGDKYKQNPFEKGTLFLFCGGRPDRIKGLLWMGTGFLLLYKRFEAGRLSWPRTTQEAAQLTEESLIYFYWKSDLAFHFVAIIYKISKRTNN